jgi:uncharacterized protein YkwD
MRAPRLLLAALAGVALIAGAAGLLLTIGGSDGGSDAMTLAGLSGLPRPGIEDPQPLDLATLGPPLAVAPRGRPAPPPPAAAAPHGRPTPVPPPPAAEAPVQPAPAAVAPAPVQQPPAAPAPAPREWLDPDFAAQVLALVNGERSAQGLAPLSVSSPLTQGAQEYARTLTQLGKLSHVAVGDLTSRVLATGYVGNGYLGEVLWFGGGAVTPGHALASWLASPGHAGLILSPAYANAGIGCFFYEAGSDHEVRCVLILAG